MYDHPNMSYCMCENTLLAMRQIVDAIHEGGTDFLKNLSFDERRAFTELLDTCDNFMNISDELNG